MTAVLGAVTGGGGDARTDAGWITSSTISQAAAIAVTLMQIDHAKDIFDKQHELAENYYKMAKRLQDYWFSVFSGCEAATVAESCGEPKHYPNYNAQAARFSASAKRQFKQARLDLQTCVSRFCTGARDTIARELAIAEAKACTDAINFGYRYAEHRAQALNDVRWSQRIQALGLGRNIIGQSLGYAQAASGAYSSLGQQAQSSLNSSLQALGYAFNRNRQDVPQYQNNSGANYVAGRTGGQYGGNQTMYHQQSNSPLWADFDAPSPHAVQQSYFRPDSAQPNNYQYNAGNITPGTQLHSFQNYTNPQDGGFFRTNNPGTGG